MAAAVEREAIDCVSLRVDRRVAYDLGKDGCRRRKPCMVAHNGRT